MNLKNNEQEIPEVQLEEYASKLDAKDFACRSKAKAKPQSREFAGSSPRTVPTGKRTWTELNQGNILSTIMKYRRKYCIFFVIHNLCIEKKMEQCISVELKKIFRVSSHTLFIGLTEHGKHAWQEEEELRKIFQYCTDSSGTVMYFRALQGDSGRNLIDPTLQDNVIIQSNFFQYTYHVGCAFNLHSIISSGLIPGG